MKRININHLRAIKKFKKNKKKYKITDYEKFLTNYVSIPTARKIINELIEFKIVKVTKSKKDLRVKYLEMTDTNIEKYLWFVIVARLYNNVYNFDARMGVFNKFTAEQILQKCGFVPINYSHSIVVLEKVLCL